MYDAVHPGSKGGWVILHDRVRGLPVSFGEEIGRAAESVRGAHPGECKTIPRRPKPPFGPADRASGRKIETMVARGRYARWSLTTVMWSVGAMVQFTDWPAAMTATSNFMVSWTL